MSNRAWRVPWPQYVEVVLWLTGLCCLMLAGQSLLRDPPQDSLPDATQQWFDRIDIDNNQQIEAGEFHRVSANIDVFTQLDRNEDGVLTIEEMELILRSLDPFVFFEDVE